MKWLEAPLSAVMGNTTGYAAMLMGVTATKGQPIPTGVEDGRADAAKDVEIVAAVVAAVVDAACVTGTYASTCVVEAEVVAVLV